VKRRPGNKNKREIKVINGKEREMKDKRRK
jgi:hypothetical protein